MLSSNVPISLIPTLVYHALSSNSDSCIDICTSLTFLIIDTSHVLSVAMSNASRSRVRSVEFKGNVGLIRSESEIPTHIDFRRNVLKVVY